LNGVALGRNEEAVEQPGDKSFLVLFFKKELLSFPLATFRAHRVPITLRSSFLGANMGLIVLILLIILLFGGGLGTTFGGWGGPEYGHYGYGGVGLGTILLIVLIVMLLRRA
jgi:hypothetical protein